MVDNDCDKKMSQTTPYIAVDNWETFAKDLGKSYIEENKQSYLSQINTRQTYFILNLEACFAVSAP